MNKEQTILFSKLATVLVLILSTFEELQILKPAVVGAFIFFTFDSIRRNKIFYSVFYSIASFSYLSHLLLSLNNSFSLLFDYLISIGVIIDITLWYFLSYQFNLLIEKKKYSSAETLIETLLNTTGNTFGTEHPVYATCLSDIGDLYMSGDKLSLAEKCFENSLIIKRNSLDENNVSLISLYDRLGNLNYKQHKYQPSEEYYKKAYEAKRTKYGDCNLSIAESLNNLALSLLSQNRYIEAESLFKNAISVWGKIKKSNGLEYASCKNNLALLYQSQGRLDEAQKLLDEVVEIKEKKLGTTHVDVVKSLNNLALLYYSQNKNDEGDLLLNRVLSVAKDIEEVKNDSLENTEITSKEVLIQEELPILVASSNKTCINSTLQENFPNISHFEIIPNNELLDDSSFNEIKEESQVDNICVDYESPEIKSELDYLFGDSFDRPNDIKETKVDSIIFDENTSCEPSKKEIEPEDASNDFVWPKKKKILIEDASSNFIWPPRKKIDQ